MRYNSKQILKLLLGYLICAIGIVMTINANLGLAPWDVLHQGVAKLMGISIGRANIILGFIVISINALFGENIGWGTVFNMLIIGLFIDFLMFNHLVPIFTSPILSFTMMILGLLVLGYGCAIYMSVGLGTGPRDGLMVALTKRTGKSVSFIKISLELLVVTVGYLLGGSVGIGTATMAITGGYIFQFAFKTAKFDLTAIEHRYIIDDIKAIKEKREARKI